MEGISQEERDLGAAADAPKVEKRERGPFVQLPESVALLKSVWVQAGFGQNGHPQGYHAGFVVHAVKAAIRAAGRIEPLVQSIRAFAQGLRKKGGSFRYSPTFANFFAQGYYLEYLAPDPPPPHLAADSAAQPSADALAAPPEPAVPANAIEPHLLGCLRNRLGEALFERIGQDAFALAGGLQVERLPRGQWLGHVSAALKEALLRACAPQIAQEIGLFWADSALEVWTAS